MKTIPPFRLIPEPMTAEARALPSFRWADEIVGKRHKLGGEPDFLQEGSAPSCPECGEPMTFYAQLDSINDEFCIADCGMVYVFLCFECIEVASFIQSF